MNRILKEYPKKVLLIKSLLIYAWLTGLSPLAGTDTYYSVYILCGVAGLLCLCDNFRRGWQKPERGNTVLWVFAGLFSLAVLLANYTLFEPLTVLQNLFDAVLGFLGGITVGYQILLCMCSRLPVYRRQPERLHPGRFFIAVFISICAIDLGYLFFARYPGILTTDSFSTVAQIVGTVAFDNTMPFWHTVTVLPFYKLGSALFGSANGGAALYHCAQILFMASCFAYALTTMYRSGAPRLVLAAAYAVYALMPYNIVYSMTMWKDIPFAGAVLLFVTAFYRCLREIGSVKGNYIALTLGALGMSLWRTNGWYAFLVTVVLLFVFLRRRYKKLLTIMLAVLVCCWVMINPVLNALGVAPTNLVEAFAVPMQQVARVVANDRELTAEQEELLSDIFWLDRVKELYDPQTVDPVKFETFRYDQLDVIKENPWTYLKLYFSLGLQYPGDYLKAWIEETKGYWNGGYFFWTYTLELGENPFGIVHTGGENLVAKLYAAWFRYAEKPVVLQPLVSIGLQVWALVACCVVSAVNKRREWLTCVPVLVLIAGLILGTPVYSEFRYAYPLIVSLPLILTITVFEPGKAPNQGR